MDTITLPDWKLRANCRGMDPDFFYPQRGEIVTAQKAICRSCEVSVECLTYALVHKERFGIWGGKSERERRRIRHGARVARTDAA